MDTLRKAQDNTLVCTCNELHIEHIQQAFDDGEDEYTEIMQYNNTMPRCGDCDEHVDLLLELFSSVK